MLRKILCFFGWHKMLLVKRFSFGPLLEPGIEWDLMKCEYCGASKGIITEIKEYTNG